MSRLARLPRRGDALRALAVRSYNVSTTLTGSDACVSINLDAHGITGPTTVYRNLTFDELHAHEIANGEGAIAKAEYGDTFAVDTGKFTGRSPADKWTVKNVGSESDDNLWWGPVNKPMRPEVFDELYDKAVAYFNTLDAVYVADLHCGANPETRINVRFCHELAWQQHFVTNMFIRPETSAALASSRPPRPARARALPEKERSQVVPADRGERRLHRDQRVRGRQRELGGARPQQRRRGRLQPREEGRGHLRDVVRSPEFRL